VEKLLLLIREVLWRLKKVLTSESAAMVGSACAAVVEKVASLQH
jgi:hypothetical protein